MATIPRILWGPDEGWNITRTSVASATAIARGDFISVESNLGIVVDGVADDLTFAGLANTAHTANEPIANVVCLLRCVAECDCTSDTYIMGAALKWVSTNALADASGSDTFGWAHRLHGTVTRVDTVFDVLLLHKLFALT